MTISEIHRPSVLNKIDDRLRHVINNAPTNEGRLIISLEHLLGMKPQLYVYDAHNRGTRLTVEDFSDEDLTMTADNLTQLEGFYKRGIKVTLGSRKRDTEVAPDGREDHQRVFFVERSQLPGHQ